MKTAEARAAVDAEVKGRKQTSLGEFRSTGAPSQPDVKERPLRPSLAFMRRSDGDQRGNDGHECSPRARDRRLSDLVGRDPQSKPEQNGHGMKSECKKREDGSDLSGDEDSDLNGDEYPADAETGAARHAARQGERSSVLKMTEGCQRKTHRPGRNEALDKTSPVQMERQEDGDLPQSNWRRLVVKSEHRGVDDRRPAASNARGRPRLQSAEVLRSTRTQGPVRGVSSDIEVSPSSTFLGHAAGSSWPARCGPALFTIYVFSAGVFACMSFQVFSVLRTYGVPGEWPVQNRTNDSAAEIHHRASTTSAAMPTAPEDEDFQTAPN
ncbi:hypothetical protein V5799_008231 [Amblyomma americanum]|uniref:Uncharacterized protein n=1 Tax=Amblyomma americanum TaxID=6943 RepID=A0AAQ4FF18_AMBAM